MKTKNFFTPSIFISSLPTPPDADRTLAGNSIVLLDIAGANQVLTLAPSTATGKHDSVFHKFSAGGQANGVLYNYCPNINNPALLTNPNPDLEVRGFLCSCGYPAVFGSPPAAYSQYSSGFSPRAIARLKSCLILKLVAPFYPTVFLVAVAILTRLTIPLSWPAVRGLNEIKPEPGGPIFRLPQERIPGLIGATTTTGKTDH